MVVAKYFTNKYSATVICSLLFHFTALIVRSKPMKAHNGHLIK
jgi:hypothetical protein